MLNSIIDGAICPEVTNEEAFSEAVTYLTYAKMTRARDALEQAYREKLHADKPELRCAVICGLAHHGDHQHLAEAFDLLVAVVRQSIPDSADKMAKCEKKRRIKRIAGWAHGIPRHFPPKMVAEFLYAKNADQDQAVREAIQVLLKASGVAAAYKKLP